LGFTDYDTYAENMCWRDIQKKELRPTRVLVFGGRTILYLTREQQQQLKQVHLEAASWRNYATLCIKIKNYYATLR